VTDRKSWIAHALAAATRPFALAEAGGRDFEVLKAAVLGGDGRDQP